MINETESPYYAPVNQVWGGPNSGIDGGNDGGKGITDRPGGIKLQAEGHDVLYRNIWIKEFYQLFFKLSLKRSFKITMVNADNQLKSLKE